jgi:cysteine desulfurase/selenocysteine lyase
VADTLKLLNELGTQAIDRHVTSVATQLADGLIAIGAPVRSAAPGRRANMVCIESRQGAQPLLGLQRHLQERNVHAALRRNVLRFSFHFYNTTDDAAAAQAACREWLGKHGESLL